MTVLSIITVVKDDEHGLRETMGSLTTSAGFDSADVEWIIIDSSADPDSVQALVSQFERATTVVWEPPAGIFEAMNTGLKTAAAEYVYFLNAGDRLRNSSALASIIRVLKEAKPDWLYGQVAFIDERGHEVIPPAFDYHEEKRTLFARGRFPPHQGTIVRRSILTSLGGFDTTYRITADYAAALQLSLLSEPVVMPEVVAEFTAGGISTDRWKQSLREFHRARQEVFDPKGLNKVAEIARTVRLRTVRGLYESVGRRLS